MTVLEYRDSQFYECSGEGSTEITLKIEDGPKKLVLRVAGSSSMIQKRSAERNARGISKTGFRTTSGGSIGRGYDLIVEGQGGGLPDRLKHSPREVY